MARYVIENPSKPDQVDVWWDQPQFIKDDHGKNTNVIRTDDEGRQIYRRCVCRSIDKALADSLNERFGNTSELVQEFDSLKAVVQDRHTSVQEAISDFNNALENEITVRANNDLALQTNIDATNGSLNELKDDYKTNVGIGLPVTDKGYANSVLGRVSRLEDKLSTDSRGTFATKTFVMEKINAANATGNSALDIANSNKAAIEIVNASHNILTSTVNSLNNTVSTFDSRLEAAENRASEIEELKARCDALEKFISRITNQNITFDGESYDVVVLAPEEPGEETNG